ncbi:mitochondrial carrier [Fomitiporia mediterranea MF3/22]|uniref:mitochondrial carrier n=1 Tax=Fomitiporia mediterranea (strain MF3/22) TaxID=694068 RepID=UPI00044088CB|nr:mitochondrial carrier [Fomitiporia mediterranea MF3/22]EJD08098.1 mitochondrial carrier [Fomitiporia mediterranea MF3/22]
MTSTLPPLVQACSGAIGSAAANASSYPLDLVCTRLQTADSPKRQGLSTAIDTLKRILRKRGVGELYDGLETDTAATLVSSFFYFYSYSFLRNRIFKRSGVKVSTTVAALEEIAVGFLAGVASRAVSTPLSLVTVQLQNAHNLHTEEEKENHASNAHEHNEYDDAKLFSSVASVIKHIYNESGILGFWRGFETTTLLCLNPSLTLFLFQAFRQLFLRGKNREQPTPRQAFLGAAMSNVIAVTILYPLILAKTRLQAARRKASPSPSLSSSSTEILEKTNNPRRTKRPIPHSMLDVWRTAYIHNDAGFAGLYQGLEVQLLKGFLSQGLAMMVKQRLEQLVIAAYLYRIRTRKGILP